MFCGNCGAENEKGAKFCKSCGQPLVNGAENQKSAAGSDQNAGAIQQQNTVSDASKVDVSNLVNQIKTLPKNILIGAAVVIIALVVIVCFIVKSGSTINLNKYVSIETEGYDGYGTATAKINWDEMEEDYGKKLSYTKKAKKELGRLLELASPFEALKDSVRVRLDTSDGLANGDEISYQWDVDEEVSVYLDCKVKYEDGTYHVSDLAEISTFNAFDGFEVSFEGISPNGSVNWEYRGSKFNSYDFNCDKTSGLRNGDKITFSVNEKNVSYYIDHYGAVPAEFSKEYEVEGLEEYVSNYADLTEDFIAVLKSETEDTIYAYTASSYNNSSSLTDLGYAGYIMDSVKNGEEYYNSYNDVYLIYAGIVSNSNGNFDAKKVYFPVRFRNVLKSGDSLSYESNDGIYGNSSLNNYSTRGYTNPLICYMEIVEANRDSYNAECGDGFEVYAEYDRIESLADISDDYKQNLYADANDRIESYIADRYNVESKVENLAVAGEYLLLAKNQGTDFGKNNIYYVVFSATVSNTDGRFETTTVYYPVEYDGVVKLPGDEYMVTSTRGIVGFSNFRDSWYSTNGYTDGTTMYTELITSNRVNYTYEVSEGLKQFGE